MFRSRSWFGGLWSKPRNLHSLEHLKYLYNVLARNQTVSEANRSLLVETLRSIAEILIWGDQNDSTVFDFFLEKNMLSFFLRIMRQRSGGSSFVCVQLLQTLNILFENIRNETSLYYLLSNNHVNSIIVHKFDFSDEEVMAYYISFLKTLSLKLNCHTIHFFYNEHTNDFPLYTEAIKFFNHPESMVRIAVRTLTLNVYKVGDADMLAFIRDRTAAPYFSNIVWFIGKHVYELDACIKNKTIYNNQPRLGDLIAEHLDHLHYLNDILNLNITDLNYVLTSHLLHKLLIPMYINALLTTPTNQQKKSPVLSSSNRHYHDFHGHSLNGNNGKLSPEIALYLLAQVFLILSHRPLVESVAWILLNANGGDYHSNNSIEEFIRYWQMSLEEDNIGNITDEQKEQLQNHRIFYEIICEGLNCDRNDYVALFALCLLYALVTNKGLKAAGVLHLLMRPICSSGQSSQLVDLLCDLIKSACLATKTRHLTIRLVTVEVALTLLQKLIALADAQLSVQLMSICKDCLDSARAATTSLLHTVYTSDDLFLDMFEQEYYDLSKTNQINVEWLCMDSAILLPPTGTPMTGIDFRKRLPCGEVERCRMAIRLFLLMRRTGFALDNVEDCQLPLSKLQNLGAEVDQSIDLNVLHSNADMVACTILWTDGSKLKRFLVVDTNQVLIVKPHYSRLGWGVVKLAGFLTDIEVSGDKEDDRCLHISLYKPLAAATGGVRASAATTAANRVPLLSTKFYFDDHILCLVAKQKLTKGRLLARERKKRQIGHLLNLSPDELSTSATSKKHLVSRRLLRQDSPNDTNSETITGIGSILKTPGHSSIVTTSSSIRGSYLAAEDIPLEVLIRNTVAARNDPVVPKYNSNELESSNCCTTESSTAAPSEGIIETTSFTRHQSNNFNNVEGSSRTSISDT